MFAKVLAVQLYVFAKDEKMSDQLTQILKSSFMKIYMSTDINYMPNSLSANVALM